MRRSSTPKLIAEEMRRNNVIMILKYRIWGCATSNFLSIKFLSFDNIIPGCENHIVTGKEQPIALGTGGEPRPNASNKLDRRR